MPDAPGGPDDDRVLTDQLFESLSKAIVMGDFPPGAKLSEPRLALRYGVSRGPLREAMRLLEERKLVTRTPRQGVRVVVPSLDDALDLFMIREVLEGLAARQAALSANAEDIARLRLLLAAHRDSLTDPEAKLYRQETANADFHFHVTHIARNARLFDLLCGDYYTLFRFYRVRHQAVPGRAQRALIEHERIANAIADGDGELAELLMRRHVAASREGLLAAHGAAAADQAIASAKGS